MTTVLTDNGVSVTYNRGGVTIDTLAAQGTSASGSTATIFRSAGTTVVILTTTSNDYACNLPSGAEIGDTVEVYPTHGGVALFTPSGETFVIDGAALHQGGPSMICRKVSTTQWVYLTNA